MPGPVVGVPAGITMEGPVLIPGVKGRVAPGWVYPPACVACVAVPPLVPVVFPPPVEIEGPVGIEIPGDEGALEPPPEPEEEVWLCAQTLQVPAKAKATQQ